MGVVVLKIILYVQVNLLYIPQISMLIYFESPADLHPCVSKAVDCTCLLESTHGYFRRYVWHTYCPSFSDVFLVWEQYVCVWGTELYTVEIEGVSPTISDTWNIADCHPSPLWRAWRDSPTPTPPLCPYDLAKQAQWHRHRANALWAHSMGLVSSGIKGALTMQFLEGSWTSLRSGRALLTPPVRSHNDPRLGERCGFQLIPALRK